MRYKGILALTALAVILAYPAGVATQATFNVLGSGSQVITKGALYIPDSYLRLGVEDPTISLAQGDAFFSGDVAVAGSVSFAGDVAVSSIIADANTPVIIGPAAASITLGTDGSGDGEITMSENAIGPSELGAPTFNVILCGELAENGTTYFGPSTGAFGGNGADLSIGSVACDALDNTTEATADAPIFSAGVAFRVLGGYCKTDGTLGASETLTFTVRSATGSLSGPTCVIGVGGTDCKFGPQTSNVLPGGTLAIKADEVSDNADDNGWCMLSITL